MQRIVGEKLLHITEVNNNYCYFKVFAVQQKADRENENIDEQAKHLLQDTSGLTCNFYMYQEVFRWHLGKVALYTIIVTIFQL